MAARASSSPSCCQGGGGPKSAVETIQGGSFSPDVLVIRYESPPDEPGMHEMLCVAAFFKRAGCCSAHSVRSSPKGDPEAVKWLLPIDLAFCLAGWLVDPRGGWGPCGCGRAADEPFGVGLVSGVEDRLSSVDDRVSEAVV